MKAVRGTKDIVGEEAKKYDFVITKGKNLFEKFGYNQIITPIFEETSLFARGIGEGTDIVEKEMYTFEDRGGRSITLRPEGTASVVRSYLEHKIYGQEDFTRYFYYGPMFRYERPQAGRYRQFNQLGIEALGNNDPALDAEIIFMAENLCKEIKIEDIEVSINSVGCPKCRSVYREALLKFLETKVDNLCGDCQTRYKKNPMRVLDCKVESCQAELKDAPVILDYLDDECKIHFEEVKKYLDVFKVSYKINPKLVRGLDYYTNTVFELITTKLGAQGTVLGGGRYNGLIEEVGGKDVPGVGFAAGIERLMMLLPEDVISMQPDAYIVWLETKAESFGIAQKLRVNDIKVEIEFSKKSMKAQMKKASKLNARFALIIGEEEVNQQMYTLKDLENGTQEKYKIEDIISKLKEDGA